MYSFDKVNSKWSDLADDYQSMIDELSEIESDDEVLVPVSDFDEYEVL